MTGQPTVTSKKCELIPKIAVGLHVLESAFKICKGTSISISEEINQDIIQKAVLFVESLEEQKETFKSVRPY